MPKILARDPGWLARPSPASQIFRQDASNKAGSQTTTADVRYDGPHRRLAHRDTELFVAVGNELRWSDMSIMKDAGEDADQLYRVLKTPVSRNITQLSVSPSGDFIAILTSHTCHIAILPSLSHLHSGDTSPLKLRTFQVGPTAHVLEQAPLVSALWHPLSPSGNCLVTVTRDACVRLWELNRDNRSSFDEPSLAVDLKKLANATSTQADFSASKYGTNKGFSPDHVEMQVAAACFGGQGREDEHGWASMTLWVAMSEGDVYALCPFLPSKWRAPLTLKPSLTTSAVAKMRAISQDEEAIEGEKRVAEQQCKWLAELDAQEPVMVAGQDEFDVVEVYSRPERPGPIPKLQGPFYVGSELDIGEITDIHAIAARLDNDDLFDQEDDDEEESEEGLSVGIICIATSTSKVHICLDLDGVEAEWLPSKRSRAFTPDDADEDKDLLLFETIDLSRSDADVEGWPTFTPSPIDRYEIFTTTLSGVYALDFKTWTASLEDELAAPSEAGTEFRINVFLDSSKTAVSQPIELPTNASDRHIDAAIATYAASIGFLLLTSATNAPYSALLDIPSLSHPYAPDTGMRGSLLLPSPNPRAPYQPAEDFFTPSLLPNLMKTANEKRQLGTDLKSQVRFSTATLKLMTDAHKVLSAETHRLGLAAAELWRRCERMRAELREQVRTVREISARVEAVVDERERGEGRKERVEERVRGVQEKTEELNRRVEGLRRKMGRLGGQQLSVKERAFADEVAKIEKTLGAGGAQAPVSPGKILQMENSPASSQESEPEDPSSLAARFNAVESLRERLVQQVHDVTSEKQNEGFQRSAGGGEFRRRKLEQVRGLLERETALVEGVAERLARLSAV